MKSAVLRVSVLIVFGLAGCGQNPAASLQPKEAPVVRLATAGEAATGRVVRNSYIVTFRSQPGASLLRFASFRDEYRHHFSYLASDHLLDPRIKDLRYLGTVDLAYPHDPNLREALAPPRALRFAWDKTKLDELPAAITAIDFASQDAAVSMLKEWESNKAIWFAEPNYTSKLQTNPYTPELTTKYQDAGIWWHQKIKLPQALQKLAAANFSTTQTPVIAVLDSGVDIEHPRLKNHIFTNPSPGASGCSDDLHGCDTTKGTRGSLGVGNVAPYSLTAYNTSCESNGSPTDVDVCEHGTHVAGIIAADLGTDSSDDFGGGFGAAVGGVCPVCKVLPIKIISDIDGSGAASDESIINAMQYVALFRSGEKGAVRIVNSSFGKYAPNRAVELLVSVLGESSSQILVVAAASNEDSMLRSFPAAYPGAIGVAATGQGDEKASYSNFGPWVHVSAPGGNSATGSEITSTLPGGRYGDKQGTSMAAPVVAGVAGLILSYDQNRSVKDLRSSIISTADPRIYDPGINDGINYLYYDPLIRGSPNRWPLLGSGIVDAEAALDGKSATYSGTVYNRVQSGCGSVAVTDKAEFGSWWLLLLPVLIAVIL